MKTALTQYNLDTYSDLDAKKEGKEAYGFEVTTLDGEVIDLKYGFKSHEDAEKAGKKALKSLTK